MDTLVVAAMIGIGVFIGARVHMRQSEINKKPLPQLNWDDVEQVAKPPVRKAPVGVTPLFGERPHFFTPPSDQEQYQLDRQDSAEHKFIPYPNDPPHTFPAIKARQLFTKRPKTVRDIYIPSADSVDRANIRPGFKLRVPFQQLEQRFRSVYKQGEDQGTEITVNAATPDTLVRWKRAGLPEVPPRAYDFHGGDALQTPPLTDSTNKSVTLG
uniref:Gsp-co-occurring protein 11 n=1 Tax=Malawimonas jakobiformis TaxID=136089 RepID=A0A895KNN9_MALJA|nr:Gsp-co-occurring protein 11 [Malawimonas jakobiformis]